MKKRESAVANLTFIALMSAINAIFSLFTEYIPALSLIIYLFLPFISAITVMLCKYKFFIIYIITSILLCLLINFNGFEYTIFTLIPSLISGTIFGICLQKRTNIGVIIFISSICHFLITMLTIPLINLIYTSNRSIIEIFANFLGKDKIAMTYMLFLPLMFVSSLAQNIISFLIISSELLRFKFKVITENRHYIAYSFFNIIICMFILVAAFLWNNYMYLLLSLSIVCTALSLSSIIISKKSMTILATVSALLMLAATIILAERNLNVFVPMTIAIFIFVYSIIDIGCYFFKRNKQHAKMNL